MCWDFFFFWMSLNINESGIFIRKQEQAETAFNNPSMSNRGSAGKACLSLQWICRYVSMHPLPTGTVSRCLLKAPTPYCKNLICFPPSDKNFFLCAQCKYSSLPWISRSHPFLGSFQNQAYISLHFSDCLERFPSSFLPTYYNIFKRVFTQYPCSKLNKIKTVTWHKMENWQLFLYFLSSAMVWPYPKVCKMLPCPY